MEGDPTVVVAAPLEPNILRVTLPSAPTGLIGHALLDISELGEAILGRWCGDPLVAWLVGAVLIVASKLQQELLVLIQCTSGAAIVGCRDDTSVPEIIAHRENGLAQLLLVSTGIY